MQERGLYATFEKNDEALRQYATYFKEHGPQHVLNALEALTCDGLITPKPKTKPVQYARVTLLNDKDLVSKCLSVYQEVRDPAWTNHKIMTRTLTNALNGLIKQVGKDAPNVLRRGLVAQRKEWAAGKKLDLVNLLTNDKVIRFSEREQTHDGMEGMVYRLNLGKPHPSLPDSSSYAIRVDARDNGSIEGFVFPEGDPHHGIMLEVPTRAASTPLRSWSTYLEQYA